MSTARARTARRTSVFLLASLLVSSPASPRAGESGSAPDWLEATLLSVDVASARATYRVEASGEVHTASVRSRGIVERLATLKPGQKVRLRFGEGASPGAEVVIEEAKKKGRPWWHWALGAYLVVFVVGAVFYVLSGGVSAE